MAAFRDDRIDKGVAADEARKWDLVVLVRRARLVALEPALAERLFVLLVKLPAREVVAPVVEKLARVAKAAPAGLCGRGIGSASTRGSSAANNAVVDAPL